MSLNLNEIFASLSDKVPQWGPLIGMLEFRESKDAAPVDNDGRTIYYNTQKMQYYTLSTQMFYFAQQLMHVQLAHAQRGEGRDPALWKRATDDIVNEMLVADGFQQAEDLRRRPEAAGVCAEDLYVRYARAAEDGEDAEEAPPEMEEPPKKKTDVTWEICTLRAWLNDDFLNKAFDAEEQSAILITEVDNSDAQGYSGWITSGGNNTKDKIFLLSYAEANRYLDAKYWDNDDGNNTKSRIAPTEDAIENGAWFDDKFQTADGRPSGWWWLRSPGESQDYAAFVTGFGSLYCDSVIDSSEVVRPAFWLNLESGIF